MNKCLGIVVAALFFTSVSNIAAAEVSPADIGRHSGTVYLLAEKVGHIMGTRGQISVTAPASVVERRAIFTQERALEQMSTEIKRLCAEDPIGASMFLDYAATGVNTVLNTDIIQSLINVIRRPKHGGTCHSGTGAIASVVPEAFRKVVHAVRHDWWGDAPETLRTSVEATVREELLAMMRAELAK